MNKTFRVEIKPRMPLVPDAAGQAILSEIRDFGINTIDKVEVVKVYKIGGIKNKRDKEKLIKELFLEPLWQQEVDSDFYFPNNNKSLEITLKPGVTNTETDSIISAAKDMGFHLDWVQSDRKIILWGKPSESELSIIIDKILLNKTIEMVVKDNESLQKKIFSKPKVENIQLLKKEDADLIQMSKERLLYLSLSEMKSIQNYFIGQSREPTDCELETIAQTWSEHCSHKTFRSPINITGKLRLSFLERIKASTKEINHPDCLVTFSDNAGIVSFNGEFAFCAKAETHNSPTALEPFGGTHTGSGGVFRDIAAAGLGGKSIATSDIFCFGFPTMNQADVPAGCLHPKRIMQKAISAVADYCNKMGIPTVNGSLNFDSDYRAKPVVLVGAFGIMPKKHIFKKKIIPGDLIVSLGGKTGRDGIHGATFSSGEMTKETELKASSAVQIGNPIEEKKMFDALLVARDQGIIKNISDCGGGGYSSAITEMGREIGIRIDLSKVPLKYQGLDPWEIWLSESQERMVIAVSSENINKLDIICNRYNTAFTILGKFTGSKKLELVYKKAKVAGLTMDFLFNGMPKRTLEAEYVNKFPISNFQFSIKKAINYNKILRKILSNLNVASKEEIVRRYDHEVQGRLVLKPFLGVEMDSPQDGAIVKPLFNSKQGLAFGHGLSINTAKIDPYWGAVLAVDEAVRNIVSIGADPGRIFLLDNFIFPIPTKEVLGDLDRAVDGICDAAICFKTPFISGKDSLSGTYKNETGTIQIPSTIIVSSIGVVPDIKKTISSDFKKPENRIYLLGEISDGLGGSVYSGETGLNSADIPVLDLKKASLLYKKLFQLIQKGLISSCHDISEGGLAVTLAEMCFGIGLGANISLDKIRSENIEAVLFSEGGGRFMVEVSQSNAHQFKKSTEKFQCSYIGKISSEKLLQISSNGKILINEDIDKLKKNWQDPFKKYF